MNSEYYIPSSVISAFVKTCEIKEMNPYPFLAQVRVSPKIGNTKERNLKVRDLAKLLDMACSTFGSYSFAISFAKQYEWYKIDEKTLVLSKQYNLQTLTIIFNVLLKQQSAGPELSLTQMGNSATYRIKLPEFSGIDMIPYKLVMIAIWNDVMFQAFKDNWSPKKFNITGLPKKQFSNQIEIFDLPVFFDSKTTSIEFNSKLINQELSFDIGRSADLKKAYSQLLDVIPLDILTGELLKMVIPGGYKSIEQVALMIGTSPRLLQKKLKGLNTSFSGILSNVRMNIAKDLLLNTSYPINDISNQLAFQSSEAFVRFFKLHENSTPLKWRRSR